MRWICIFAALAVTGAAMASRPEPNAFLNTRADSVSQLVAEVHNDPEVADRYERHFGKTRSEVEKYFGTLHLAKLNEDGTYMIYSVDDLGIIKVHAEKMKAGTRVFADANGSPILKAHCGNALVSGSNSQLASLNPQIGTVTTATQNIAITTPLTEESATQMEALAPGSPVALAPSYPPTVTTGNQGFAPAAALLALGGAGSFLISGHGGTPVPEPASLIVIGGALLAYTSRRKRR